MNDIHERYRALMVQRIRASGFELIGNPGALLPSEMKYMTDCTIHIHLGQPMVEDVPTITVEATYINEKAFKVEEYEGENHDQN